jgi:hypothetical protein
MQPRPECDQRRTLWERYHAGLRAYIRATNMLDEVVVGPEFDRAYDEATLARFVFERLRSDYTEHITEHGCV